jgi:AAA domain-containing protein
VYDNLRCPLRCHYIVSKLPELTCAFGRCFYDVFIDSQLDGGVGSGNASAEHRPADVLACPFSGASSCPGKTREEGRPPPQKKAAECTKVLWTNVHVSVYCNHPLVSFPGPCHARSTMHEPPPIPVPDDPAYSPTQPVIVQLSKVTPEPVQWLWQGRIPIGKLTLLVGDPAVGKSLLATDIAARVSSGAPWPDDSNTAGVPGGVVLLCTEDDLADTVRPRLDAAGADHSRVTAITSVRRSILSPLPSPLRATCLLPGLPHLEAAIQNTPECRLVLIDPIIPSLNRASSHSHTDARAVMEPLAELATRHHVAIVAVHRAPRTATGFALNRLAAKLAPGAARTVWALVHDADSPKRRLFVPVQNTIAQDAPPLPCYIASSQEHQAPVLKWADEPVGISAQGALDQSAAQDHQVAAREWLRDKLAKGPEKAACVLDDAKYDGFSHKAIRQAFRQIQAQRVRSGYGPGGFWVWAAPLQQEEVQQDHE